MEAFGFKMKNTFSELITEICDLILITFLREFVITGKEKLGFDHY